MVARIYNYSFLPATKRITLKDVQLVELSRVQYIINVTKGVTLYSYSNPTYGTISLIEDNIIQVSHSTAGMLYSDELEITYDFPIEPEPSSGGTVTSVAASGGTTGLSFTGSPITTSGTLTLTGTLATANGGTGLSAIGTALQALRVNAGATGLEYYTPTTGTVTSVAGTTNQITSTGGTTPVLALASGGTLPGAWALGTPASGTVTNLTGTASININGTVGATTPNTGAFTTGSFSGQVTNTTNGAASTPPSRLTGTWFTGGTATTTKPQLLIEPTGTASTAWSTSGTGLGINAASGFSGRIIDAQVAGVTKFNVDQNGSIICLNVAGQNFSTATITVGGWYQLRGGASTDGLFFGSLHRLNWGSATINTSGTKDIGIGRSSAGVLEVNNGTAGTLANVSLASLTASTKINITTGSNKSAGVSGAMTAGTITISTTAVTASSLIYLTHATLGGVQGILSVGTITAGTSFVINSSSVLDTGTCNWWIIN